VELASVKQLKQKSLFVVWQVLQGELQVSWGTRPVATLSMYLSAEVIVIISAEDVLEVVGLMTPVTLNSTVFPAAIWVVG
jgi:hypothetical protein